MSDSPSNDEKQNNSQQNSGPVFMTKVLLLGSAGVGKNTLVNRIFKEGYGKVFHNKNKRTDFNLAKLDLYLRDALGAPTATVHYDIYSTSTKINHSHTLKKAFQSASYVIFQFDISSRQSFEELNSFINSYIVLSHRHDVPILVVGNKSDLSTERTVDLEEILAWTSISRTKKNIIYIECSAKTGHGIADITSYLLARYQEKQEKANRRAHAALTAQWSRSGIAHMSSSADSSEGTGPEEYSRNLGILNPNIHGTDDDEEEERRRNRWSDFELKMAISLSEDLHETDSSGGDVDGGDGSEREDSFDAGEVVTGRPELHKRYSNASRTSEDIRSHASGSTGMTSVDRHSIRSYHSGYSGGSHGVPHSLLRSGTRRLTPTDFSDMQNVIESSYIDRDTHRYYGVESDKKNGNADSLARQPTDKTILSDFEEHDYLYDADAFLFQGSAYQRFDGNQRHKHSEHQRQSYQRQQYDMERGCMDYLTCGLFCW